MRFRGAHQKRQNTHSDVASRLDVPTLHISPRVCFVHKIFSGIMDFKIIQEIYAY